ncbi:MAG: hypothetical protein U1E53_33990 [Dongiaceae bacterium]
MSTASRQVIARILLAGLALGLIAALGVRHASSAEPAGRALAGPVVSLE